MAKRTNIDADGLNPRQRRFALEYLLDLNATQAAIRAGYSVGTARVQGPRLLSHAAVAAFLQPRLEKKERRLELTAQRLDDELARIAFVDPGKLVNENGRHLGLHELDEDTRRAVAGVKVRTATVLRGKDARHAAAGIGIEPGGDDVPLVEELTLGTLEVKLSPKVEAIMGANKVLGRLRDRIHLTGRVRNLSHEQILLLARQIRTKLAGPRSLAGKAKPGTSTGGGR